MDFTAGQKLAMLAKDGLRCKVMNTDSKTGSLRIDGCVKEHSISDELGIRGKLYLQNLEVLDALEKQEDLC